MLGVRPPKDQNIAILPVDFAVPVGSSSEDYSVPEKADEDTSVQIWAIDHRHRAGGVIEILKARGESTHEAREVVLVQEGLVSSRIRPLDLGQARPEVVIGEIVERMLIDLGGRVLGQQACKLPPKGLWTHLCYTSAQETPD